MQLFGLYISTKTLFEAHVVRFGYVHHIVIDMEGRQVTVEKGEEGNYRALIRPEERDGSKLAFEVCSRSVAIYLICPSGIPCNERMDGQASL